jgi:hypothetical protein
MAKCCSRLYVFLFRGVIENKKLEWISNGWFISFFVVKAPLNNSVPPLAFSKTQGRGGDWII